MNIYAHSHTQTHVHNSYRLFGSSIILYIVEFRFCFAQHLAHIHNSPILVIRANHQTRTPLHNFYINTSTVAKCSMTLFIFHVIKAHILDAVYRGGVFFYFGSGNFLNFAALCLSLSLCVFFFPSCYMVNSV